MADTERVDPVCDIGVLTQCSVSTQGDSPSSARKGLGGSQNPLPELIEKRASFSLEV